MIQASAVAFTSLKLAGAAYLLYLAWRAFQASAVAATTAPERRYTGVQLYRRGIIMNVSNPKVTMFFLAFMPQFIDPATGPVFLQIILLGGVFVMATLIIFGGVALLAGRVGLWLNQSPAAQVWLNRAAGLLFIGLAVHLVLVQR